MVTKVLVVEDEIPISEELIGRLEALGVEVPATTAFGEDAIIKAGEILPDLVLMDINLEGEMDGIEAAEQIRKQFDIPIIYLTAYADKTTLARAKKTDPLGYITKPFKDRDLEVAIELALYRKKMEEEIKHYEEHLEELVEERSADIIKLKEFNEQIVKKVQEGLFIESVDGIITFANPRMLEMLECSEGELQGKHWEDIFAPDSKALVAEENARTKKGENTRFEAVLRIDGRELQVMVSSSPLYENNTYSGNLKAVVDVSKRKETEERLRQKALNYKIKAGKSYLVQEKFLERGLNVFNDLTEAEYAGLIISRAGPDELEENVGEGVEIIQLSRERKGKEIIPPKLDFVTKTIEDFMKRNSVVLLDRFDYLIVQNGFSEVLKFLNNITDLVSMSKSILIVVIDPETLSPQELSLLEKETEAVETKYTVDLDTKIFEILEFIKRENDEGHSPVYKDVMKAFNITRPTTSIKLKELIIKDLVIVQKRGRFKSLNITDKGREVL